MDTTRLIVQMLNVLPYNSLFRKVIHKVLDYMPDGSVMTRYNYWIEYKKTGPMSNLRKSVISGSYERADFEIIKRLVNLSDTVIDIGANEGYISLWLSKIVGLGSIFAIEPNPENLVFLNKNIQLNAATNINVIEKAVSDQKGTMPFFCSPNSGAWGSLTHFSYFSGDRIDVDVDTLDNLFGDLEQLNFLKVDTEGNEFKIFLGARQILARHKPHICFEVNLTFWAHNNQSVDEVFNCLYDLGYKLFTLKSYHLCPYEWLNERIVNIFAIHTSRVSELTACGIISSVLK